MPKLVLALGAEAAKVEAVEGFANYSGPTPPAGLYFSRVKQIGITETKQTKKTMLRVVIEFKAKDDKDSRKKFNGYAIFHHLVIPEDATEEHYGLQVGQINRLLDAMSGNDQAVRNAFWGGKADLDAAGKKITKIGKLDLTDKEGIEIIVSARSETFNRKVLVNGKPVRDPKTKKEKYEQTSSLRVNDTFPADDEIGKDRPELVEAVEEDDLSDVFVDEDESDAVVADADSGLDDSADDDQSDDSGADDNAAEEWPEEEAADASDGDFPESSDPAAEADADDDSADLIAQEVPDTEPAEEPAAPPQRKRRSAF